MGPTLERPQLGPVLAPDVDLAVEPQGFDFGSNASQQGMLAASGAPPSGAGAPLSPEQQAAKTALTSAILRRVEGPVAGLMEDLPRLVREETDLAVRDAVWADPAFREHSAWSGHGLSLQSVLRQLSSIQRLRRELEQCALRESTRDSQALEVVQAWVARHNGMCDAAIAEGMLDTIVRVVREPEVEYEAVATLLFKGQLPTGSNAQLEQAIAVGDADRFIAAWIVLLADPTEALALADNPSWLHRVETKLGADTYQTVLSDVMRLERVQVAQTVLQDLEGLISNCLSGLQELNDTFHVADAPVLSAIKTFFAQLDGVMNTYNVTDVQTRTTALNTARSRLMEAWTATHGTQLGTMFERGLSPSTIAEIGRLLNIEVVAGPAQPGVDAPGVDTVLADLIRTQAGQVRKQFDDTVWVDDADAVQSIRDAQTALRAHVRQSSMGVADEQTQLSQAMHTLRQTYDQQYSLSLVNDIHNGVDDDALAREALQLIGDRLDPNARLMAEAVAQSDADRMDSVSNTVSELSDAMRNLAERFHGQMVNVAWVSDSNVLSLCSDFHSANAVYRDFGSAGQDETSATSDPSRVSPLVFLENHYRAIGGDLRRGIAGGLDLDNADVAFERLGLGGSVDALRADGDGRSAVQISARQLADERGVRVFRASTTLTVPSSSETEEREDEEADRRLELRVLGGYLSTYAEAVSSLTTVLTAEGISTTPNVFRETTGINLADLLSLHLMSQSECTAASEAAGLVSGVVQPRADAAQDITLDADDPALQYNITETMSYDFSLAVAETRAREWHRQGSNDGATMVNFSETGSAEENRIVRQVFRRLYGYDVEYMVHRRLGFGGQADTHINALEDGGLKTFTDEIQAHTADSDREQLIACVMRASAAELQALLSDGQLLHDIRSEFSQEVYDHVYRAATGQLSLGDVLRENDAGFWSMGMDFGSDEEGATSGTEQFIKYVKRRFEAGELADMPASEQSMLRGIFLDGDTQAMLSQEFSGSDLLTLRQLILHGGERSKDDELEVGLESSTRGRALLDMLAALTVEERQTKLRDVGFMQRLAGLLTRTQMGTAMGILAAAPGEEYDYQLDKAFAENGQSLDDDKLMDTLLGMPMDALYRQSRDRIWVDRISRQLNREQRPVFAHLMAECEDRKSVV